MIYLEVGELSEGLLTARVATLVRPVAGVNPGRESETHTALCQSTILVLCSRLSKLFKAACVTFTPQLLGLK